MTNFKEGGMITKEKQIAELALFRGASRKDVDWVARNADALDLAPGATLAVEGDRVREFIVLVEGSVVGHDGDGVTTFGRGSCFGHDGLQNGTRHAMTLQASTPARVLVFDVRIFRSMCERIPCVSENLAGTTTITYELPAAAGRPFPVIA